MDRIDRGGLKVAGVLADFIEREVLPGTHVHRKGFWQGFEALINRLAPVNRALLHQREALQQQIDDWHAEHRGQDFDVDALPPVTLEDAIFDLPAVAPAQR